MAQLLRMNLQEVACDFGASRDGSTVGVQITDGDTHVLLEMDADGALALSSQLRCLALKADVLQARAAGAEPPVIIGDNISSLRALRDPEAA